MATQTTHRGAGELSWPGGCTSVGYVLMVTRDSVRIDGRGSLKGPIGAMNTAFMNANGLSLELEGGQHVKIVITNLNGAGEAVFGTSGIIPDLN